MSGKLSNFFEWKSLYFCIVSPAEFSQFMSWDYDVPVERVQNLSNFAVVNWGGYPGHTAHQTCLAIAPAVTVEGDTPDAIVPAESVFSQFYSWDYDLPFERVHNMPMNRSRSGSKSLNLSKKLDCSHLFRPPALARPPSLAPPACPPILPASRLPGRPGMPQQLLVAGGRGLKARTAPSAPGPRRRRSWP